MSTPTYSALDNKSDENDATIVAQSRYMTASFKAAMDVPESMCKRRIHFPDQLEELTDPVCVATVDSLLVNGRAQGFYTYSLQKGDEADTRYMAEMLARDPISMRGFMRLMHDRRAIREVIESAVSVGRGGRVNADMTTIEQIQTAIQMKVINPEAGYTDIVGEVLAHLLYANLRQAGVATRAPILRKVMFEENLVPTYADLRRNYLEYAIETALDESKIGLVGRGVNQKYLTIQALNEAFASASLQVVRLLHEQDCYSSDFDMIMTITFVDLLRPSALESCEYETRPGTPLGTLTRTLQGYINIVWMAVEAYNSPGIGYPEIRAFKFAPYRVDVATRRMSEWASNVSRSGRFKELALADVRKAIKQTVVPDHMNRIVGSVLSFDTTATLDADLRYVDKIESVRAEYHIGMKQDSEYLNRMLPNSASFLSYDDMHQMMSSAMYNCRIQAFVDLTWDELLPHAMAASLTNSVEVHYSERKRTTSTSPGKFSLAFILPEGTRPNVLVDGKNPFRITYGEVYRTSNPMLVLAAQGDMDSSPLGDKIVGHQTLASAGIDEFTDTSQIASFHSPLTYGLAQEMATQFDDDGKNIMKRVEFRMMEIFHCRGIVFNMDEEVPLTRYLNPLAKRLFHIHFQIFKCMRNWLEKEREDKSKYATAVEQSATALNVSFYNAVLRGYAPQELARLTGYTIDKYLVDGYFSAFSTRQLDVMLRANVRSLIVACVIGQLYRLNKNDMLYILYAMTHQDIVPLFQTDADLRIKIETFNACRGD